MSWKTAVVGWLLKTIKVNVDTICNAIEGMDVDQDGSLDLGELVTGILRLVRR